MSPRRQNRTIVSNVNANMSVRTGDVRSGSGSNHVVQASVGSGLSPSQIMHTSPQFYSPIHTPVNWQIPSKRREVYLWCLTPSASCLMADYTYKNILDVKVGDLVITHKGNTKKVNSIYSRYVDEDIYRLDINGLENKIELTGNHEIFGLERNNVICDYQSKRKHQRRCIKINNNCNSCSTSKTCFERKKINLETIKIKASNIKEKDYVYEPINSKIEICEEIESKEMARFLGYYLAEGNCYINKEKSQYSIDFTFNIKEEKTYIKELNEIIKKLFNKEFRKPTIKGNTIRVAFQSKQACFLIKKHITGIANSKKLSKEILNMPKEWLFNFIGAYLNGDGSYSKEQEITLTTASYNLSHQLKSVFNKLGILTSKIMKRKAEFKKGDGKFFYCYVLSIPMGMCEELIKHCDTLSNKEFKINKKSQSFINENRRFNYIKKIEKFHYTGNVYCLGVDDDESFVADGVSISNCRFFSQMEPKVVASLRFYSQFPFSGFNNVLNDPIRSEHFDALRKRLNLDRWLPLIAYEYFTMGDVFPFISFFCDSCGGSGVLADGNACDHKGGTVNMISVLNPDWIDVKMNPIDPNNPVISLVPDDTLKQIVWSKTPPEVYAALPDMMKKLILANKPIPLSKRSISHLKHDEIPYQPYGRSLIASLFPTLAYADKLKQAQWIVAERHILPIKVVKVGNDQRPAGAADIADVQSQLAMTANDPNLTLVTHHAFAMEFIGASGKVLQLTKEWDLIDKNIIQGLGVNEALLSGCIPQESRLLTNDGFKTLEEFDIEKHALATINPNTKKMEWQFAEKLHIFDHNSEDGDDAPLIHFKNGKKLNNIFTNNHEMYVKRRNESEYKKVFASDVKHKDRFILKTEGWDGKIPENVNELTMGIPLDMFLQLSAYFISEGSFIKEYNRKEKTGESYICSITGKKRTNRQKIGLQFVQIVDSDIIDEMMKLEEDIDKYGFNIHHWITEHDNKSDVCVFRLNSVKLTDKFLEYFGEYSEGKKIPSWMKDLPSEYLEKLIYHLVKCDGNERKVSKETKIEIPYYSYTTTSKKLNSDLFEILLKTKQSPTFSTNDPNKYESAKKLKTKALMQYTLGWSPGSTVGDYPEIRNAGERKSIFEYKYKGKVWCVTVPNGLIFCEHNGRGTWTGNSGPSYSQAAIGIEATIRRLDIVRNLIANWIEEKIYKEEARMQGFYKENLRGEKELDYPKVKWDDLNLRDETQKNQMYMQLWDKGIVSTQFVCEKFGIDYEAETERVRLEQQFQQQFGIAPKQRGPGGKGPGGKGGAPMGGGFGGGPKGGGGGMPGGDPNKGNLPGGQSGPGLPGDSIAPSMSGGEGGPMASLNDRIVVSQVENNPVPHSQSYELAKQFAPAVSKPGKFRIKDKDLLQQMDEKRYMGLGQEEPEEEEFEIYEGPRTGLYRPTNIEGILYSSIAQAQEQGNLPMEFLMQQNPEPERMPRITCDGIFPTLRLIIEADGKQFHSSQEDIEKNQGRDDELRSYGWTVLRYTEDEIKYKSDECLRSIIENAQGLMAAADQTHPE